MNAPVRILTHSADGSTVEHVGASVPEALAAADLGKREGRIALLGELAEALLAGKQPTRAAALFVGGALLAWLETDRGRLERDFFRVLEPRSHLTVARCWRALRARQNSEGRDS